MPNCLIFAAAFLLGVAAPRCAAAGNSGASARSVVRADKSTGRLVRRVVAPVASYRQVAKVDDLVEEAARKHDVDPLLVHSVIQVESNYNPFAVSPKGAQGLMQLIPETAKRFGVANSFSPRENIEGGVRYLRYLKDLFRDDRLALAAYNAGEAAVARYDNTVPPYPETQSYVKLVGRKYGELQRESAKESGDAAVADSGRQYRPLEVYVDSEGRLHLRTR